MKGIRVPLSGLVKSGRMQIRHHIDYLTARGVGGLSAAANRVAASNETPCAW